MVTQKLVHQKIYDREHEQFQISEFFNDHTRSFLHVFGESGCGKSRLVDHCVPTKWSTDQVIKISLKGAQSETGFASQAKLEYKRLRPSFLDKNFRMTPKSLQLGYSPVRLSFDIDAPKIDRNFWETFYLAAKSAKVRLIVLENIELCKRQIDYEALMAMLSTLPIAGVKIIAEEGSLHGVKEAFTWPASTAPYKQELKLANFDRIRTNDLFRFVHNRQPPPSLSERTSGNALCVVHFDSLNADEKELAWVRELITSLSATERMVLHALTILGQPQPLEALERVLPNGRASLEALESLLLKRILMESQRGFEFEHPSFLMFFNTWSKSSIHNRLKKEILARLKAIASNYEDQRSVVALAVEVGDRPLIGEIGMLVLKQALDRQDYKLAVEISGELAKDASNDNQYTLLQLVRIQSLVQIGDAASANLCFSKLDEKKPNIVPLLRSKMDFCRAIISYSEDEFQRSIEQALELTDSSHGGLAASVYGLLASNYIALGQITKAKEAFAAQQNCLVATDNPRLLLDSGRIAARLLPTALAQEVLRDILAKTAATSLEVSKAKTTHNIGILKLLSGESSANQEFIESRAVFEALGLPAASHSMLALGLKDVLEFRYESAEVAFRDALNICFEGLDRLACYANLSLVASIADTPDAADRYSKSAYQLLQSGVASEDVLVSNATRINRAFVLLSAQRYDEANEVLAPVETRALSRWPTSYKNRTLRIINACKTQAALAPMHDATTVNQDWYVSRYNLAPMALSFYGLKADPITPEEIDVFF